MDKLMEAKKDHSPRIHLNIDKESKIKIDLNSVSIDDFINMTIRGKVSSVSRDEYGQSISLKVSNVSIGDSSDKIAFSERMANKIVAKR